MWCCLVLLLCPWVRVVVFLFLAFALVCVFHSGTLVAPSQPKSLSPRSVACPSDPSPLLYFYPSLLQLKSISKLILNHLGVKSYSPCDAFPTTSDRWKFADRKVQIGCNNDHVQLQRKAIQFDPLEVVRILSINIYPIHRVRLCCKNRFE